MNYKVKCKGFKRERIRIIKFKEIENEDRKDFKGYDGSKNK